MNAFVLHDVGDQSGALRWGASAAAIVALHAALLALGLAWYTQHPPPGITMPAIMVDMAPASSSPQPTPMDLAPGPVMQQADASPPPEPAKPETVQEQIAPPPPPRTTAAPRAERQAPAASAISAGASAAVMVSYNQLIAAHLQRFKQYPPGAKAAGEQGTARLSFSLGRGGQVLGSRLAGSSGHAALDGETLAMVRRAQPFPGFPPEMKQSSMSFNVPV